MNDYNSSQDKKSRNEQAIQDELTAEQKFRCSVPW